MTLDDVKAEIGKLSRADRAALRPWLLEHSDTIDFSAEELSASASRARYAFAAFCIVVGMSVAALYFVSKRAEVGRSETASEAMRKQREAEAWDQEDDELV